MELISGSCNQILVEQGNILWINIPNFGLVRASLDGQLNPMDRVIFPDSLFAGGELHLEQGPEGIRVINGHVRYRYQPSGQGFVEDTAGFDIPAVDNLISGIYGPLPLHADYEFYPIYNGFALRYLACEKSPVPDRLTLLIKGVTAFNNAGSITVERGMRVPYKMNNIAIEYIVPNQDGISYQYLLSEEEEWSAWTTDPVLQIMGLASGDHRIVLRAGIDGRVLDERDFEFRIAAPWYASWYAFVFYFLILLLMIAIIWSWHKRSLARQQHRLRMEEEEALRMQAEQHREQVMRMEQERLQQENEQIKQQLRSKTLELARNARESEAKGRLLLSLKDKFESAQEDSFKFKAGMSEIRRLLDSFLKADDRTFEIQMDELHQEFFLRLKEKYPNLSNNDLRLSAYLKIGLNSKEIAELLNIQPSSAFISRSRLRKKLNLRSDEELFDFLNRI